MSIDGTEVRWISERTDLQIGTVVDIDVPEFRGRVMVAGKCSPFDSDTTAYTGRVLPDDYREDSTERVPGVAQ